jgi:hypothetical protein
MNVRRVLWGTWIVLTILWVCLCTWPLMLWLWGCVPNRNSACNYRTANETILELKSAFGPPIAVLLIGFIGLRIASRFKSAKS